VDGEGIPIGSVTAQANRHDSPLLAPTLEHASELVRDLPDGSSVHLNRGYDSELTRERLQERGLIAEISLRRANRSR
jgi:IS5 family transposase